MSLDPNELTGFMHYGIKYKIKFVLFLPNQLSRVLT